MLCEVLILSVLYAQFGEYVPGIFYHSGQSMS